MSIFEHASFPGLCICFEQIKMTQLLLYLFLCPKTLQQNKWHRGYEWVKKKQVQLESISERKVQIQFILVC